MLRFLADTFLEKAGYRIKFFQNHELTGSVDYIESFIS